MSYGTKGEKASGIQIPIYEVYNALIYNNVIDIKAFKDEEASDLEKRILSYFEEKREIIFGKFRKLLAIDNTVTNQDAGEEMEEHLDYEIEGIHEVLKNCSTLSVKMGGIYIDKRLEAFSMGSYNPFEDMAVVHIEKANPEIRGLYQFINQQFLINEFPEVKLINREDDMGIEGLRQAKMTYNPIGFARKYLVKQRQAGVI